MAAVLPTYYVRMIRTAQHNHDPDARGLMCSFNVSMGKLGLRLLDPPTLKGFRSKVKFSSAG